MLKSKHWTCFGIFRHKQGQLPRILNDYALTINCAPYMFELAFARDQFWAER